MESAVNDILIEQQLLGLIYDMKRQQSIVLIDGSQKERITWRMDFTYKDSKTDEIICCEAKGFETDVYRLKLKLYRKFKPHKLIIYKGSYKKPFIDEVIE